jgi:hypothetical protein
MKLKEGAKIAHMVLGADYIITSEIRRPLLTPNLLHVFNDWLWECYLTICTFPNPKAGKCKIGVTGGDLSLSH